MITNYLIFLEEMLIGFTLTLGVLLFFLSQFVSGISLIIGASIAYYLRRRRLSSEQSTN